MRDKPAKAVVVAAAAFMLVLAGGSACAQDKSSELPERIAFPSGDGRTTLSGYVYEPKAVTGRVPAVVMMHGRAGAYSTAAKGRYDASTLSQRHQMWGRLWASQGYVAILVDGFGPRGYAQGFPRFSYGERPDEVNEVMVRPLDAYGALAYLRTRPDVARDRIGLQGWSNGASATLAAMSENAPGIAEHTPTAGFRAALVFYANCVLHHHFDDGLKPYAPVRVLHGTGDKEVSWRTCDRLVKKGHARGGDIEIAIYPDATHSFDDPGERRQRVRANRAAKADATARALDFFKEQLGRRAALQ